MPRPQVSRASVLPLNLASPAKLRERMCTFPNCLCHKRFRGRGPCTSCRAWTSRKCTFFPTPGASPPGTPNWPKLTGKVPAQRHQSPGTSSIGTNVHFPQVLARQAFQESYPPDAAWHKDFTKVHIFANPRGNSLPRIPTDQTVTLLAGIQPAQYHHLLGSSVGTNVHFPQALVPQAFPGTRPLQPLQRLPFTEVHIFAIAGAPLRHSARPADQVTLLLAVVPVRPGAPVRLPREQCALSVSGCAPSVSRAATPAALSAPALHESAHFFQRRGRTLQGPPTDQIVSLLHTARPTPPYPRHS